MNKQRHRRSDTIYPYYYNSNQQQENSYSTENTSAPAALVVPPETLKQPEIQPPQDDALDPTTKRLARNSVKHSAVHPAPSETQSQSDQLDGKKDG